MSKTSEKQKRVEIDYSNVSLADLTLFLNSGANGKIVKPVDVQLVTRLAGAGGKVAGLQRGYINAIALCGSLVENQYRKYIDVSPQQRAAKRNAEYGREVRASLQEIGDLPEIVDLARRERCKNSLLSFLKTYFPAVFYLPLSEDQLSVIMSIEQAIKDRRLFAIAMPRSSGKTSITRGAALWAILYGFVRFCSVIAGSGDKAQEILESIRLILETNELLAEDFPEVFYPVSKLERQPLRAVGQRYHGEPTRMKLSLEKIVFPTIEGSASSGSIISGCGLFGSEIRGQQAMNPAGEVLRPDFVFIDDPQTKESALSITQCRKRENLLAADVLGMCPPGVEMAGILTCTVIRAEDVADNILNNDLHPEWHGRRMKMLYAEPTDVELWDKYAQLRKEDLMNGGNGEPATEFYKQNRLAMDKGAVVAWEHRYNKKSEISAIQNAMNIKFRDYESFLSEYQNEPSVTVMGDERITVELCQEKVNGKAKNTLVGNVSKCTMYIDVHKNLLYWVKCVWNDDFTGQVIDYGVFPEQRRTYFNLRDDKHIKTISSAFPSTGFDGSIYAALEQVASSQLTFPVIQPDGAELFVDRCLIDANWGQSTDLVYRFIRESQYSRFIYPAHGKYYGASGTRFQDYKKQGNDLVGLHWRIQSQFRERKFRYAVIDTNYWKTFCANSIKRAKGERGGLTFYGDEDSHHLFFDHLVAEYSEGVTAKGRTVDEWHTLPGRDNHYFDCLVGNFVAASIEGCALPEYKQENSNGERLSGAALERLKKMIRKKSEA